MEYQHEVIMCIVNAGYSDAVMDAAREFGARGGTVIHARGTANIEAEKLFNIAIQPEKEIVMILVESGIRDDILHALYQNVGLKSEGKGIAFCLPVEQVVGLTKKVVAPADAAEQPQNGEAPDKVAKKSAEKAQTEEQK